MIKDLIKAKSRVENILQENPKSRDCDKTLWIDYLTKFHNLKEVIGEDAYNKFTETLLSKDTCTMESVRRMRQKFQQDGYYIGLKRMEKIIESENVREMLVKRIKND